MIKLRGINVRYIHADEGYVFSCPNKENVYTKTLILGKNDSEENYIQITDEEAEQIREATEEAMMMEMMEEMEEIED